MGAFPHRSLRVYHAAVDMAAFAFEVTSNLPRPCWDLRQQLLKAATSVALNIAEGADEYARREKVRFFRMARRSAGETSTAFDLLARIGALSQDIADRANHRLEALAAMITNIILGIERTLAGKTRSKLTTRPKRAESVDQPLAPATSTSPAVQNP